MMNNKTKPSKYFILQEIERMISENPNLRILDLGSGQSLNFKNLVEKYPTISYTGLEPNPSEHVLAQQHFVKCSNVILINALAYQDHPLLDATYDLVISLSVLEHVKNLKPFLDFSAQKTASGGHCVHLYDLGHALYPLSIKEKIHVFLCSNSVTRSWIPEIKFASYVNHDNVVKILDAAGAHHQKTTYHNMPNHVQMIKSSTELDMSLFKNLVNEEVSWATKITDTPIREKLFPSLCVWCKKD